MDSFNTAYSLKPSYRSSEEYYKPQIKTESENNYIHVRAKATRGRNIFTLVWEMLPESDFQNIKGFFDTHIGSAFYWTHDVDGKTYTVVFSEDRLKSEFVEPYGYRRLTVVLEEI